VGRTGAGKSSLIGALFRLMEIESGFIAVDSVNTKSLGLKQLRSAMALIPQVRSILHSTAHRICTSLCQSLEYAAAVDNTPKSPLDRLL